MEQVSEKIRLLRSVNNLTQEDMAVKLNMSSNGYSKIERGETKITLNRLQQIAQIFNIGVIDLITFGDKNVYYINENGNNNNNGNNFIENPPETNSMTETKHLKNTLQLKDEIISSRVCGL